MLEKVAFLLWVVGSTWSIPLLVWVLKLPFGMPYTKLSNYSIRQEPKVLEAVKIKAYAGEIVGPTKYDGEKRAFLEVVAKDKDDTSKVTIAVDLETLESLIETLLDIHQQLVDEI
jgi:thiol:disulfide interchange protein